MNKKNNSLTVLLAPVFCIVLAGCFGGRMTSSGRGGEGFHRADTLRHG